MKHFNQVANGAGANHHQLNNALDFLYLSNINAKNNDHNKMNTCAIRGREGKCLNAIKVLFRRDKIVKLEQNKRSGLHAAMKINICGCLYFDNRKF